MHRTVLSREDLDEVIPLVERIAREHPYVEDPLLLDAARLYAHELPISLKRFLERFRLEEPSAVAIVSGFPVDDEAIGMTPPHWNKITHVTPTLREEVFFLLCSELLGDVFAWATQQDGRVMHNVLPIEAHRSDQLGVGSETTLWWHTEDAFSPFKADYVALMCLRNPDGVATTICDADSIDWSTVDVDLLFEPEYPIRPDDSHLPSVGLGTGQMADSVSARLVEASCKRILNEYENPPKKPILYGDRRRPYMSLDPYYMVPEEMTHAARRAFEGFTKAIDAALSDIVLYPGDVAFVDNLRAVHGRNAFVARYDGTDRWLKRLNISRNLRTSRSARRSSADRVVF